MFIKRDDSNNIIALSHLLEEGMVAATTQDVEDMQIFLRQFENDAQIKFQQSDLAMARVLEDVVNLLVDQGTIRFTDLPEMAQKKLLLRREMRGQHLGVDLIDDNDYLDI